MIPDRLYVGHTGAAVGFTSLLFMSLPLLSQTIGREEKCHESVVVESQQISHLPPICVAIMVNLESANGIGLLGIQVAEAFTQALVATSDHKAPLVAIERRDSTLPAAA